MTYDDDNERVERTMFSVPIRCTAAEARRVFLEIAATDAWREWSWRNDVLNSPGARNVTHPGEIERMSRDATDAYRKCIMACAKAVAAMEAER